MGASLLVLILLLGKRRGWSTPPAKDLLATAPTPREDGGAGFPGFDCLCADFELQFALAVSRALESKELAQLLVA